VSLSKRAALRAFSSEYLPSCLVVFLYVGQTLLYVAKTSSEHGVFCYSLSHSQNFIAFKPEFYTVVLVFFGFVSQDQEEQAFFAVFDGHGGVDAAIYAANHLHVNMVHQESFSQDPSDALCKAFKLTDERFVRKASREVTMS